MVSIFLAFAAGLVVGWFFLPTPSWVKAIYTVVMGWFKKNDTTTPPTTPSA